MKPDPGAWPLTQDTWSPQQSLMPLMPRMSDVTPHRSFKLLTLVSERLLVTSALGHTSLWHADAVLIGVISWPLKLSNEESSWYYNMYVRYMKVPDEGEWVNHDISSEIWFFYFAHGSYFCLGLLLCKIATDEKIRSKWAIRHQPAVINIK